MGPNPILNQSNNASQEVTLHLVLEKGTKTQKDLRNPHPCPWNASSLQFKQLQDNTLFTLTETKWWPSKRSIRRNPKFIHFCPFFPVSLILSKTKRESPWHILVTNAIHQKQSLAMIIYYSSIRVMSPRILGTPTLGVLFLCNGIRISVCLAISIQDQNGSGVLVIYSILALSK